MRAILTMLLLTVAAGCAATAPPPPPSGPAGRLEGRMANCPAAVTGAITNMTEISGGVALEITAVDLAAAREIVRRAGRDPLAGAPDSAAGPHSGAHGGPGDLGHCPIVHRGTHVTVTEIGGGVRIVVTADDPSHSAALVAETRERLRWLDPANRR